MFTGKVKKASQELRMLSSVTINCQVTKIVINPGSQLSVLLSVSQMSQAPMIAPLENTLKYSLPCILFGFYHWY